MPCKILYFLATLFGVILLLLPAAQCDGEEAPVEVDKATENDLKPGETVILDEDDLIFDGDDEDKPKVEEEDGVLVLNSDNFDSVVMDKDIILVEFYAPWCGHCKTLAPEFAKAAKTLKNADPSVPLAKVDATVVSDIAKRYEVSGYPTLKIFRNGDVFDYEGPREETGIVRYMKEQSDPNWKPPPEAVLILTTENFDETVNEADLILVEFYAPWCGHCKKIAPELEAAAGVLKDDVPPIQIAKVDATAESDLASRFGVSGYPTLFIFRKGEKYEYNGPREKRGILDYMRRQAGASSEHLSSPKALKQFLENQDEISIVGFFKTEEEVLYKSYLEAGNDLREDYRFGHTFDHMLMNNYKVNPNSIVIFFPERMQSKYEPKRHVLDKADATAAEIQIFYSDHNTPLVGHMTKDNIGKQYRPLDRPLLVAYYDVDWSFDNRKATEIWRQKILAVAKDKEFRDITFAIAKEEEFTDQIKELGLDDSGEEINIGLFADGKKYKMDPDEDFDSDMLKEFLQAWRKNKLDPVIKSQPTPRKQSGPVTVVVGKTFEKIVLNSEKDVMIELYAPWCGHCKKLEPTYKKLAKKYKDKIVIAKMDATANDTPSEFSSTGFPTIYFAKADDKKNPLKFEGGDRSIEALSKFIDDNASTLKSTEAKDEL